MTEMVLHPLTEIREWDEALAVLGIQDSHVTPAEAVRELNAEIERLSKKCKQTSDALTLLWAETVASGNAEAKDYGWPKARAATLAALSATANGITTDSEGTMTTGEKKDAENV